MKIIRHVPNLLTLSNLLCGLLAVKFALAGDLTSSSWCIFIASVFDFSDGFAARLLKAYSELGKQLDSLADMVSFGVAPSFILYQLLQAHQATVAAYTGDGFLLQIVMFLPLSIALFSALRLAKFNIDERQSSSFIGLPTPANAMLIASIPFTSTIGGWDLQAFWANPLILILLTLVFSWMLVSPIPLFALKFKHFRFRGNEVRYIFLGFSLILIATLLLNSIAFIILLYVIISVLNVIFAKGKDDKH